MGVLLINVFDHISLTISIKPSLNSHPNSNLNIGCVAISDGSPEFIKWGVWSDTSLVRARTVVSGNFSSHSMVTST
jgi:hypothetical protein